MVTLKTWWQSFSKGGGKKRCRAWIALLIFTLALQFLSIWNLELSGRDSPRVAGISREMEVTSNYLIPRLNGENFLEYPPLGYWPIALTLSMSKEPVDFLAFLPMIFLGTGTVLITFLIGKTLAGEKIGLMAGFILSTTLGFVALHEGCRVDPTLLFLVTLSLYGFAAGYHAPGRSFLFFAVFYLAMAGAFLSKGIIGVAIPTATAVVFLITRKDLTAVRKLFLSPEILFFLGPIFLWVGSVWRLEGPGIFEMVIWQSLWRFFSPLAEHGAPFYYYFIPVLLNLLPWTFLPLILLWYRWGPIRLREPLPHGSLLKFVLVWSLTVFIGLSLASVKRPLYLGPIYPPFALLAALGWDDLRLKIPRVRNIERYGLMAIFLIIAGTFQLFVIPSENKKSLRPVFEAVSSQQTKGPVYLVNPSETLRGASFFYLGGRMPVLKAQDLLSGKYEDRSGTTFVIDPYWGNDRLFSDLQSKGCRLLLRWELGKGGAVFVSTRTAPEGLQRR